MIFYDYYIQKIFFECLEKSYLIIIITAIMLYQQTKVTIFFVIEDLSISHQITLFDSFQFLSLKPYPTHKPDSGDTNLHNLGFYKRKFGLSTILLLFF